jgi:hypothetical protein
VIDQHRLLLSPVGPALPANFLNDFGSNRTREWRAIEAFARLPAPGARYICHCLLPRVLNLGEAEERKQTQINPSDIELVPLRLELG